jgi:hypothetical protein
MVCAVFHLELVGATESQVPAGGSRAVVGKNTKIHE